MKQPCCYFIPLPSSSSVFFSLINKTFIKKIIKYYSYLSYTCFFHDHLFPHKIGTLKVTQKSNLNFSKDINKESSWLQLYFPCCHLLFKPLCRYIIIVCICKLCISVARSTVMRRCGAHWASISQWFFHVLSADTGTHFLCSQPKTLSSIFLCTENLRHLNKIFML